MDHSPEKYSVFAFQRAVVDSDSLSATEKAVLFVLSVYADRNTGECWPTKAKIAARMGVDPRTAQRVMSRLESGGAIVSEGGGGGRGRPTIRRLNIAGVIQYDSTAKGDAGVSVFDQERETNGAQKGRHHTHERETPHPRKGDKRRTAIKEEQPIEQPTEQPTEQPSGKSAAADPSDLVGLGPTPDDPLRVHVGSELARVCGCGINQITPMRVGEVVRAINGHASRNRDPTEWGGSDPYDPIRMATAAIEVAAGATLNGRKGARAVAGVVGYAVAVIAENRGFGEYPETIARTAPMTPGERKRAEFAEKLKAAQALREKRQ
jgi:hypothetical protein